MPSVLIDDKTEAPKHVLTCPMATNSPNINPMAPRTKIIIFTEIKNMEILIKISTKY